MSDSRERRRAARKARKDRDVESPLDGPIESAPAIPPEPIEDEEPSHPPYPQEVHQQPYQQHYQPPQNPAHAAYDDFPREQLIARITALERALTGVLGAFSIPFTAGEPARIDPVLVASRIQSVIAQFPSNASGPSSPVAQQVAIPTSGTIMPGNVNLVPLQPVLSGGARPVPKKKDQGIINSIVGKTNSMVDSMEKAVGLGPKKSSAGAGTMTATAQQAAFAQQQQVMQQQQMHAMQTQQMQMQFAALQQHQQLQAQTVGANGQFHSYPGAAAPLGHQPGAAQFGSMGYGQQQQRAGEVPLTMTRSLIDRTIGDTPVSSDLMM